MYYASTSWRRSADDYVYLSLCLTAAGRRPAAIKINLMKSFFTLFPIFLALGLAAQPVLVKDIYPGDDAGPRNFTPFGDMLIFRAESPDAGVEPWITDGTEAGTFMLGDLNPDPEVANGNSNPSDFTIYNGLVYFKADDGVLGDEFFVTDGTVAGTQFFLDIQEGDGNGNPFDIVLYNGLMYFTANDGEVSSELWSSDGTAAGTSLVIDIQEGSGPGNPNFKTVFNGELFFTANDGLVGSELWKSDGTAAGTVLVKDIRDGGNSLPSQFTAVGDLLFFRANDGVNGTELWATDGTTEGTYLVKDINPGSGSGSPGNLFSFGGLLFFEADNGADGDELWVSDGTEAGTMMVLDINPGSDNSDPGQFTNVLGILALFTADDGAAGEELWELSVEEEGNPASVVVGLLDDINPGPEGSDPEDLVFSGSAIYFSATTADFGQELYEYAVDMDSAVRISDINTAGDADIDDIVRVGNRLFFEATDGTSGDELWTLEIPIAELTVARDGAGLVSGDTLDFGQVFISEAGAAELQLSNAGTGVLVLYDGDLTGGLPLPFTIQELEEELELLGSGESLSLTAGFLPTEPGTFVQNLRILSSDPNAPVFELVLRGEAVVPAAVLEVSLDEMPLESAFSYDFGMVLLGGQATEEFAISNLGNIPLNIAGVTLSDEVQFSITELESPLAAGSQDTFLLAFAPASIGLQQATLAIATDALEGGEFTFNLSGTGEMESGTQELNLLEASVFPNPAMEALQVRLERGLEGAQARVFDGQGRLVWAAEVPAQAQLLQVAVGNLPAGAYVLDIRNAAYRGTYPFVKQ